MNVSNQYKGLTLDPFQVKAFKILKNHESVIVSAPTGSGKTLIVDYAIDIVLQEGKRLIYTSPIKALSNQKFRDFSNDYGREKVGIMTGDVTINRKAPIIIMTTEILRNMLYNNPNDPEFHNLHFVTFDEIHYINDSQRGVVWEESLILLPSSIPILLLSATIPNTHEIKSWLEQIKQRPFHVISHFKRPVPLQTYYFDGHLHQYKGNSQIKIDSRRLTKLRRKKRSRKNKNQRLTSSKLVFGNSLFSPVDVIEKLDFEYFPALYFIFSRKATQKAAQYIAKERNLRLLSKSEFLAVKSHLDEFKSDLELIDDLQQKEILIDLLKQGIGFHHAGILPILKEIIEGLFSKGLIKLLFATETFAMGLNMPARTVIFHSVQKFDGESFRTMTPGEFHQMAGRAGRRGMDLFGNAIIVLDLSIEVDEEEIIGLIDGKPEPLESQFRLSYNAICNLLQTHDADDIIRLLKSSFKEYSAEKLRKKKNVESVKQLDKLEARITKGIECYKELTPSDAVQAVEQLYMLKTDIRNLQSMTRIKMDTTPIKNSIDQIWDAEIPVGRIVQLGHNDQVPILGVIVKHHRALHSMQRHNFFLVEIVNENGIINKYVPKDYKIFSLKYPSEHIILDLKSQDPLKIKKHFEIIHSNVSQAISSHLISTPQNAELIIRDKLLKAGVKIIELSGSDNLETNLNILENHPCYNCEFYHEHRVKQRQIARIKRKYLGLKRRILESENLSYDAFKRMVKVLKDLKFMDSDGLNEKGFLLSFVHHDNDILIADAIFRGLLSNLSPSNLVAVFAIFSVEARERGRFERVPRIRNNKEIKNVFHRMIDYEKKVKYFEQKRKVPIVNTDNRSFSLRFAELARLWSLGKDLEDLIPLTTMSEGDIINHLRRVLNLMTQTRITFHKLELGLSAEILEDAILSIKRSHVITSLEAEADEDELESNIFPPLKIPDSYDDDTSSPLLR